MAREPPARRQAEVHEAVGAKLEGVEARGIGGGGIGGGISGAARRLDDMLGRRRERAGRLGSPGRPSPRSAPRRRPRRHLDAQVDVFRRAILTPEAG